MPTIMVGLPALRRLLVRGVRKVYTQARACALDSIDSTNFERMAIVEAISPIQSAMPPGMSVPKSAIGPHAIRSAVTPEIAPMDNSQCPMVGDAIGPRISSAPAPNPTKATYLATL